MKKMLFIATFCGALVTGAAAQSAKVVQLSPQDAAEAKWLYAAAQDAQKKYEAFRTELEHSYVSDSKMVDGSYVSCWNPISTTDGVVVSMPCPPPKPSDMVKRWTRKDGWEGGFDFSDDFKFIVPKTAPPASSSGYPIPGNWGCYPPVTYTPFTVF